MIGTVTYPVFGFRVPLAVQTWGRVRIADKPGTTQFPDPAAFELIRLRTNKSRSNGQSLAVHSARRTSIGFTRAARRAGRYAATIPLANRNTTAAASVQPS